MINSRKLDRYPSYRYDDYFVLKITPLLWLTIAYGVHHVIVVGMSFVQGLSDLSIVKYGVDPLLVGSNLPALLVIVALSQRRPGGAAWARSLWVKGRTLLAAGFAAHILLTLSMNHHAFEHRFNETTFWLSATSLLDGAAIAFLYQSNLVRDIFADFPSGVEK